MFTDIYQCGPVEIRVATPTSLLRETIHANFNLYNVPWGEPEGTVELEVEETSAPCVMLSGNYLTAQRTNVDLIERGLAATSPSGACASYSAAENKWSLSVPPGPLEIWPMTDLEHLLSLIVTTAWRSLGWVPLHAGTITDGKSCAILCATSGGGKTTLTAAMIRRKWKTLGDDKLLLRKSNSGRMQLRALVHTFNLYPGTRKWFPEIGDIGALPHYSVWTDKRRVRITEIWPGKAVYEDSPTHLVHILQNGPSGGLTLSPLKDHEVLSILLRQTVIPTHRETAGQIFQTIAKTASGLRGIEAQIGQDAYRDPECLVPLELALS